ncbi:hypothetical protein [Falsiroseomonas sp. CW058]|uniref:hypothetical protein n=1 Tax=Falsiroseomonas sp. CW058 TaxID=3388664 RepID=UPI003D317D69
MNATPKRLVVIDADSNGPARGASFDPAGRDAIAKALEGSTAKIIEVDQVKLNQVDPDFPEGKLAATGKPTLPLIKRATYERLVALATPVPVPAPPVALASSGNPLAAVKVGSVVLAWDDENGGWWEAVVQRLEHNGATLRLKWRDFPEMPQVAKPLTAVALPPANGVR